MAKNLSTVNQQCLCLRCFAQWDEILFEWAFFFLYMSEFYKIFMKKITQCWKITELICVSWKHKSMKIRILSQNGFQPTMQLGLEGGEGCMSRQGEVC